MRETPINSLLTKTYPMVTVAQWLELITVLYLSFYSVGKIELFNQLSSTVYETSQTCISHAVTLKQ